MALTKQEQLIFDTLHYRPPADGTSFVVNEPGLRLVSSDASFLPFIRSALLDAAQNKNWRQLYGLDYVIGAFLVQGTKYAPETLVPFILSLPQVFTKEVLAAIAVFFRKNKENGDYNFLVAPTRELIQFVRELAYSDNPEVQKAAQRTLKMIKG